MWVYIVFHTNLLINFHFPILSTTYSPTLPYQLHNSLHTKYGIYVVVSMVRATFLLLLADKIIICCVDPHPLCNFITLFHISIYGNHPLYNFWSHLIASIAIRGCYDAEPVFRCSCRYVVYCGGLCGWRIYRVMADCYVNSDIVLGVVMLVIFL